METEIAGQDEKAIGVRVWDQHGNEHIVNVQWDGEFEKHSQDDYPRDPDDRTDEEEVLMRQVRMRALTTAHEETDADLLPTDWQVSHYERGIRALDACPDEQFEQFRDLYDNLQDPPVDVPREDILFVTGGFTMTDEDRIDQIGPAPVTISTGPGPDDSEMVGPDPDIDADIIIWHPPATFEWPFGDRFREFLTHHLRCQIRDIYFNRGEHPPERYQVEGFGKVQFNGMNDPEIDAIRFPHD